MRDNCFSINSSSSSFPMLWSTGWISEDDDVFDVLVVGRPLGRSGREAVGPVKGLVVGEGWESLAAAEMAIERGPVDLLKLDAVTDDSGRLDALVVEECVDRREEDVDDLLPDLS